MKFIPRIFLPLILPLIISFLDSFNDGKIQFWWIIKIINFGVCGILSVSKVFTVVVVTVRAVSWPEINVSNKTKLKSIVIYINIFATTIPYGQTLWIQNAELKIIVSPQKKHKRIIIRIVVVINNFLLLTKIVEN